MNKIKKVFHSTLANNEVYKLVKNEYTTEYVGCQCYKDCTCKEDFIPESYFVYNLFVRELQQSFRTKNVNLINAIVKGLNELRTTSNE